MALGFLSADTSDRGLSHTKTIDAPAVALRGNRKMPGRIISDYHAHNFIFNIWLIKIHITEMGEEILSEGK